MSPHLPFSSIRSSEATHRSTWWSWRFSPSPVHEQASQCFLCVLLSPPEPGRTRHPGAASVTALSCSASGPPESACSSRPAATAGLLTCRTFLPRWGVPLVQGPLEGLPTHLHLPQPVGCPLRASGRGAPGPSPTGRPHASCFHPQVVAPAAGHPQSPRASCFPVSPQ